MKSKTFKIPCKNKLCDYVLIDTIYEGNAIYFECPKCNTITEFGYKRLSEET